MHESKLPTNTEIGWNEYVTCNRCDYTTYEELPVLKKEYLELEVFEENGNKYLYFGKYPQTHVNDNTLISQLNNLTVQNINGYYELNQKEYAKVVSFGYSGDEVFSTGSTVVNGQVEWFIVEPIKWRIIYESADNKLTLLSELIIDSGYIYKGNSDFKLEDRIIGDKVICPNNYEFSMMREYLNSTFIDMAFSTEKLQYISDTVVDNSADTTMDNLNQYACSNTVDKVFLLSYQDMFNPLYNFTSERIDPARESFGTDYAIAKGLWMNCWSLRSPDHGDKNYMMSVGVGGYAYYQNLIVNSSGHGIRPALVLDLN